MPTITQPTTTMFLLLCPHAQCSQFLHVSLSASSKSILISYALAVRSENHPVCREEKPGGSSYPGVSGTPGTMFAGQR